MPEFIQQRGIQRRKQSSTGDRLPGSRQGRAEPFIKVICEIRDVQGYPVLGCPCTRTEQHRGSAPGIQVQALRPFHQSCCQDPGYPKMPGSELRKHPTMGCPCTKTEEHRKMVHRIHTRALRASHLVLA